MPPHKPRQHDRNSGVQRLGSNNPFVTTEPVTGEGEGDYYSDSELNDDLEKDQKYETAARPKGKGKQRSSKRPQNTGNHGVIGAEDLHEDLEEEKARETESKTAPHAMLILAAGYYLPIMSIVRPDHSYYIPDCYSMFSMLYAMANVLYGNDKLHELCPQYVSPALYLYYGYVYFYQVLRAKAAAGMELLSREEKRCLAKFENIGKPESWPISGPMIGFIEALGIYKSNDPTFGFVIPQFPNFAGLSTPTHLNGLVNLHSVAGIQRVPIIPAMSMVLQHFATNNVSFDEGYMVPIRGVAGSRHHLSATHMFCRMTDSTAATGDAFQSLAFSSGWNEPTEFDMSGLPNVLRMKQNFWRRASVVSSGDGSVNDIEKFLAFTAGYSTTYFRYLQQMMNTVNRFFPGSTNLSKISPITHVGTLTKISATKETARTASDHKWYRGRQDWSFKAYGYDDSPQGRILGRMGMVTATNMEFDQNVIPVGTLTTGRSGPFFVDDNTHTEERRMRTLFESEYDTDPVRRFDELLGKEEVFNATGGK